jgi:hypothetical protein
MDVRRLSILALRGPICSMNGRSTVSSRVMRSFLVSFAYRYQYNFSRINVYVTFVAFGREADRRSGGCLE